MKIFLCLVTSSVGYFYSTRDCAVCSWGVCGWGRRIALHIWRKQMLRFFGARSAFPRCHCFRFHLREASRLHISLSLSLTNFFFLVLSIIRYVAWTFCWTIWTLRVKIFFFFLRTMGDIEAPDSNRPRQTVLMSILPSKEFATSRKGMLLIGEVVRNEQRNNLWNKWNCPCAIVSPWCAQKSKRAAFWRLLSYLTVIVAVAMCGFNACL